MSFSSPAGASTVVGSAGMSEGGLSLLPSIPCPGEHSPSVCSGWAALRVHSSTHELSEWSSWKLPRDSLCWEPADDSPGGGRQGGTSAALLFWAHCPPEHRAGRVSAGGKLSRCHKWRLFIDYCFLALTEQINAYLLIAAFSESAGSV